MVREAIIRDYEEASVKYTKLNPPNFENGIISITGGIDVIDDLMQYWDTYSVQIVFPTDYPTNPPDLFEVGGKIEPTDTWHVNKKGDCCLSPRAKVFFDLPSGITLLGWLDKLALPFLANHVHKKKFGEYANGEYSHGVEGIFEFYGELFHMDNHNAIIDRIKKICGMRELGKNAECFCGSGKKYKRCYILEPGKHYMGVPLSVLKRDLRDIEPSYQPKKRLTHAPPKTI
jgi:hypothetical protein